MGQIAASDRYATYISENEIGLFPISYLIDLFTNVIAPYERLHELMKKSNPHGLMITHWSTPLCGIHFFI